jgi:hypothetical protein
MRAASDTLGSDRVKITPELFELDYSWHMDTLL